MAGGFYQSRGEVGRIVVDLNEAYRRKWLSVAGRIA